MSHNYVPHVLRILIVDDVADQVDSLGQILTRWGYSVRTAVTGAASLVAAADFAPHVALLDVQMPLMDGVELAQTLRRNWPAMLLVAISGTDPASCPGVFNLHFGKPVDLDCLKTLLSAAAGSLRVRWGHAVASEKIASG